MCPIWGASHSSRTSKTHLPQARNAAIDDKQDDRWNNRLKSTLFRGLNILHRLWSKRWQENALNALCSLLTCDDLAEFTKKLLLVKVRGSPIRAKVSPACRQYGCKLIYLHLLLLNKGEKGVNQNYNKNITLAVIFNTTRAVWPARATSIFKRKVAFSPSTRDSELPSQMFDAEWFGPLSDCFLLTGRPSIQTPAWPAPSWQATNWSQNFRESFVQTICTQALTKIQHEYEDVAL